MVKPEKFGHLHLVYHFTVPLRTPFLQNTLADCFCNVLFSTKMEIEISQDYLQETKGHLIILNINNNDQIVVISLYR